MGATGVKLAQRVALFTIKTMDSNNIYPRQSGWDREDKPWGEGPSTGTDVVTVTSPTDSTTRVELCS